MGKMLTEGQAHKSSAAAEYALTSKGKKSVGKGCGIDARSDNDVNGQTTTKRSGGKRGRNRRRKKREGKSACREDKEESAMEPVACRMINFHFENCKDMLAKARSPPPCNPKGKENVAPKKRERRNGGGDKSNRKAKAAAAAGGGSPPAATMISDAIVKIEQIALEVKQTEKRKLRLMKKSDLIRKGQSGWAGACFDRSPSPSLLPMPPSILLEMASRSNFWPEVEEAAWDFGDFADFTDFGQK